jgi:3-isopropylmalate/(R)-2-methylmalate dehydratase large subunit
MARDLALFVIGEFAERIEGKAVVLTGSTIDALSISEKMSLCNFLPECGVATALILPQGERDRIDLEVDSRNIGPMLRAPGPGVIIDRPGSYAQQNITVAIAGGCSSGRLDDMKVIGDILAKSEVHRNVTFIVTPGSRAILSSMDRLEISSILRDSGAVIMPPGCGPCPGNHFGVLSERDVAITTTIRNSPGRIGADQAQIYLASPLTVALSAISGRITEPIAAG